jgi:hypothetical protein
VFLGCFFFASLRFACSPFRRPLTFSRFFFVEANFVCNFLVIACAGAARCLARSLSLHVARR